MEGIMCSNASPQGVKYNREGNSLGVRHGREGI